MYYDNADLAGTTVTRVDPVVAFDLGHRRAGGRHPDARSRSAGAVPSCALLADLHVRDDVGRRRAPGVDGRLMIDAWTNHARQVDTGAVTLTGGR